MAQAFDGRIREWSYLEWGNHAVSVRQSRGTAPREMKKTEPDTLTGWDQNWRIQLSTVETCSAGFPYLGQHKLV